MKEEFAILDYLIVASRSTRFIAECKTRMIVHHLTESTSYKIDYHRENVRTDDPLCIANKTGSGLSHRDLSCAFAYHYVYTGQDHASRPAEVMLLIDCRYSSNASPSFHRSPPSRIDTISSWRAGHFHRQPVQFFLWRFESLRSRSLFLAGPCWSFAHLPWFKMIGWISSSLDMETADPLLRSNKVTFDHCPAPHVP